MTTSYQYRNVILADNPVAYFRLGENYTNFTKTRDESANWFDGTLHVSTTAGTPGAIRSAMNAMSFDGSTGYISAATSGLPSGSAHWSIEAWGYTTNAASVSTQTLLAFGSPGATQLAAIQFKNTGGGCFAQVNISGTVAAGSAGSIASNTWYHVVGTYDGTNITLYVNGVQTAQSAASPNINLQGCSIGATLNAPANFFIGSIDEPAIYSTVLSLSQINLHYWRGIRTDPAYSYAQTVLADAPLDYWRLEETSGTTATDQGSLAHNGTLNGTITKGVAGAIGNDPDTAMTFDGASGYISLPAGFAPAGYTALSVECWVKMTVLTGGTFPRLIASDLPQTTHNGFDLGLDGTSGTIFWNVGNGTTYASKGNATIASTNTWYHLVCTWDGSNLRAYLNGAAVGSPVALTGTMGTPGFATNLARNPQTGSSFLPGVLDEVAIYNTCLSATQVSNHYTAGTNSTLGPWSVTISRGKAVNTVAGTLLVENATGRRSQASFTVKHPDTSTHYQQYQPVDIYDHNCVRYFSGYINNPLEQKPGFQSTLTTQITCMDQHWLADKRIVYDNVNKTARTYTVTTVQNIVNDLVTTFLAAEGVTTGNVATMGTVRPTNFNYPSVAQALDALAKVASDGGANWYWYIDINKQIWFQRYTAVTNPIIVDGTLIDQVTRPARVTRANPLYRNVQFVNYASNTTTPNANLFSNGTEITNQAAIDGTSGQIECVLKDMTVGAGDALNEAGEIVNRYGLRGTKFEFTSRCNNNFIEGQEITVTYSPHNFSSTVMLIESVRAEDAIDNANVWYTVTAVVGPYDTNWVQFMGGIITAQQAGSVNVGV